ncbi:hypothetical protein EVG20_g795 [Dentipellis fragilis]|uniref:Uncharacterized protein n=1 Tax=Dentipellis fragilis TaxID=205917 RepID=A0A4Y9ZEN9_9AGAM|nr:hypothetical protein EVG20_g795 [Dentipellis fragilis]
MQPHHAKWPLAAKTRQSRALRDLALGIGFRTFVQIERPDRRLVLIDLLPASATAVLRILAESLRTRNLFRDACPVGISWMATAFLLLAYIYLSSSLMPVLGRNEIAATCGSGWHWASNSVDQDPCTIATQLSQVCAKGHFLEPLDINSSSTSPFYKGPSTADPLVRYGCSGQRGQNIALQTSQTGHGPESTGISSAASTSTTSVTSSSSSTSASAASQTSNVEAEHKASHNAAEAGIIMAVVVGVALLGGLVTHLYQVYRRPQGLHGPPPTNAIYDGPPLSATEGKYPGVRYGHVSTLSTEEDGTHTDLVGDRSSSILPPLSRTSSLMLLDRHYNLCAEPQIPC